MKKTAKIVLSFLLLVVVAVCFCSCSLTESDDKEKYTVTVVNGTGGGSYEKGSDVTVTADVKEGKVFASWNEGETVVSTDNPYTFKAEKDVTLTAVYTEAEKVTVTVENAEGSGEFYKGSNVTLTAPEVAGKRFVGWKVADETVSSDREYTFVANTDVTVTATYVNVYTLTVEGGTGSGTYDEGTTVTLTATVGAGKRFVAWKSGVITLSEEVEFTVTVNKDMTIVAETVNVYTITVEGGTGSGTYDEGATVSVTATVPDNKAFVKWVNGNNETLSTSKTYEFVINSDVTLTAVYANMVTLNRAYTTLTDIGSPTSGYSVESENVYKITSSGSAVTTLPHTYDNFEMTFVMFGTGDYGDPSGNFRIYIGDTYCYYFRTYYYFAGLLGTGEDENNPVGNFTHGKTDKVRYRIVYKNGSLSLYYAKYDGETLGEETLARTVEYAKQERAIKFSCYKAEVKITDFAIKYEKPEFEVGNYTVTVTGGTGSGTYREDQKATVTLDAGTENFVKWVDGNGNVLSKEESFSFYPTADITVTAVCAGKVEKTKVYATKEDLGTTAEGVTDANGVITINRNSVLQFTLAETYDEFELSFDMFGTNNYGDPSGNFRLYIGDTYCYYFRAPYNFAALLGTGEDENNPPNFFKHYDTDKVRYRIVYKDGSLSLYYAKYTDGVLGEETLARTVEYAKQEREIKFSFYQVVVSLENFTVKYMAVEA